MLILIFLEKAPFCIVNLILKLQSPTKWKFVFTISRQDSIDILLFLSGCFWFTLYCKEHSFHSKHCLNDYQNVAPECVSFINTSTNKVWLKETSLSEFCFETTVYDYTFKDLYDTIYTISYYSGFYSSLKYKIWLNGGHFEFSSRGEEKS